MTGTSEDDRTGVPLHEYTLDEVRLQENPKSEARTDENQGCSYSENGFKRMKRGEEVGNSLQEVLQVSASKLRAMAEEGMGEGGVSNKTCSLCFSQHTLYLESHNYHECIFDDNYKEEPKTSLNFSVK